MKNIFGKILYGSLFIVFLPAFLVLWSNYTYQIINLPVPQNAFLIFFLIAIGLFFFISGMHNLWFFGKGLPMNAYPPKFFVMNGVYAISGNPIYLGTILLSFGLTALLSSPSGFWLISPLLTLMIIAYTLGFENEMTEKNFGPQTFKPFLSLPESTNKIPNLSEKFSTLFTTFLPWLLMYETFIFIGPSANSITTNIKLDSYIPIIETSFIPYFLTYFFVIIIPFILKKTKDLRNFSLDILLSTGIGFLIYFTFPFVVIQKIFLPQTIFGELILLERTYDGITSALPSFHVILAFIAAKYFSTIFPKYRLINYLFASIIALSCLTTGNHSILDLIAGLLVFILVSNKEVIWSITKTTTEQIANSWKEWNFGNVRIINHSIYAGLSGFFGTLIGCLFLENNEQIAIPILGLFSIIGAALWAQFIEGSPKLQRPFGYYGSVLGVIFGSLLIGLVFQIEIIKVLAAVSLSAPIITITGRLRCLVQGCCHGHVCSSWLGIKFTHPLSRVNKISHLKGEYLHPTQLYSIAVNLIIAIVLFRFFTLSMPPTFIIGMYLILNSLGRFIEESLRGELQTPYFFHMRIYQWIAMFFVLLGAVFTAIPTDLKLTLNFNHTSILYSIILGLFCFVAYGVDFPKSKKRFARLTSE